MWEWIEDHFNGLGDFKAHLLYDDFSTPCFDGRHNMIMVCDTFTPRDARVGKIVQNCRRNPLKLMGVARFSPQVVKGGSNTSGSNYLVLILFRKKF